MENRGALLGIIILVIAFVLVIGSFKTWETNSAGEYQIKEAFWTGEMSVRSTPGTYNQNWGSINTYKIAENITLSQVKVLFPEGYAIIDVEAQYEVGLNDSLRTLLHVFFHDNDGITAMVTQQVLEALENTGALMSAEEAYTFKRGDFIKLAREQAIRGLYKSSITIDTIDTQTEQKQLIKKYDVKYDRNDDPVITKTSLLDHYKITLPKYNINIVDFDEKLRALIDQRKDAQLAQQEAITEKALGEKRIAKEKADQEVIKIKEVTVAQKNKEVAELGAEQQFKVAEWNAKEAKEIAKKIEAEGMANAAANRALVNAGLTPLEKAKIDKETAIGVAAEMAKTQWPDIMIFGGGDKGSPMNPWDAMGFESWRNIQKSLTK